MREILFRGKRMDNGEWVEGCYYKQSQFYGDEAEAHVIITSHEDLQYDQALDAYDVIPETVGQFTGLTDKNGKKIFEGDMVIAYDMSGYTEGCGAVNWNDLFCAWHMGKTSMYGKIVTYEIIGNIHDGEDTE